MSEPAERVMVITGTSRGIGRGMAQHFAGAGYAVSGCSRGESTLTELPNYEHHSLDVCDEAQVREWARGVKRRHGRVDVAVCNVGLVKLGALTGLSSLDAFRSFVEAIQIGTFLVCREFSKIMALQRHGRIVNVTSIMTELHAPGTSGYASAKAGVVEFTKVLARELADSGVTCNVVSPSVVRTDSSSAFGEEWMTSMLAMQTIKRPIDVAELCHVVAFFAAPESSCVTGQVVHTCLVS
ncbi:MAG: SDR family oxidoreductase [Candidatus Elarobacter sp.]